MYRKHTEKITNEKLGTVKVEPSVKKLEEWPNRRGDSSGWKWTKSGEKHGTVETAGAFSGKPPASGNGWYNHH